jgi:hypothetical protein
VGALRLTGATSGRAEKFHHSDSAVFPEGARRRRCQSAGRSSGRCMTDVTDGCRSPG